MKDAQKKDRIYFNKNPLFPERSIGNSALCVKKERPQEYGGFGVIL